jgi:hypothetical protein
MQQIEDEQAQMFAEMEENARNAAIATANAFNDIMAGLKDVDVPDLISPSAGGEGMVANIEAVNTALYNQAAAAGADITVLAELGVATGQFSEEQAEAALMAAALQEKILMLGEGIAAGRISVDQAINSLGIFQEQLLGTYNDAGTAEEGVFELKQELLGLNGVEARATVTVDTGNARAELWAIKDAIDAVNAARTGQAGTQAPPPVPPPRPPYSGRAAGGFVGYGQPYMVGEAGPELFVPNASGMIIPNHALGGSPVMVSVNNYFEGAPPAPTAVVDATYSAAGKLSRMLAQAGVTR